MRRIKSLTAELNIKGDQKQFDAYKLTDENFVNIANRLKKLEERNLQYYCSVYHDVTVAYGAGTNILPFNSTNYPQYGNMHDNTNDNNKIFIRRSGVYVVAGEIQLSATGGGAYRTIAVRINRGGGVIVACSQRVPASTTVLVMNCSTPVYLYTGDTIELIFAHDAGVNIDVTANFPRPALVVMERREDLTTEEYGLLNPDENAR